MRSAARGDGNDEHLRHLSEIVDAAVLAVKDMCADREGNVDLSTSDPSG